MKYFVRVQPTKDQGTYETMATDHYGTVASDALSQYNSARAHDGQAPISRMPKYTIYLKQYNWIVVQYTGSQYGWEEAYEGNGNTNRERHDDALARCKEYRLNQPEMDAHIRAVPMK